MIGLIVKDSALVVDEKTGEVSQFQKATVNRHYTEAYTDN